ncbi:biliverdin-producing heme oxygenase [Paraflavisolibacter sp. H34]|uniref:biliverdin-producing heme oxygenase n=1 Tax=Huijunlia imazamoxiresistens TaxID=3127457 RepID=UPI0030192279
MLKTEMSVVCTELLKTATRENHQETEAALLPLLKGIRKTADYAAVLRIFYGYYHPLEQRIGALVGADLLPDIDSRRKSGWLLHDLEQLDLLPQNLPQAPALPLLENPLQALGALYVLEGSTLGGTIIAKMLQSNPHIQLPDAALTFFRGYGSATAAYWKAFRRHLDAAVRTEAEAEPVVRAANDTFLHLKHWILNK